MPSLVDSLGAGGELGVVGREGRNATLPHTVNAFTTSDGAEVMNQNCLGCHSGKFDGELVIGMGNATADFTAGLSRGMPTAALPDEVLDQLGLNAAEKDEPLQIAALGTRLRPGNGHAHDRAESGGGVHGCPARAP